MNVNEQSIAQMLNEAFPPAVRSALDPADLVSLAERVREELELRVGERLSAGLPETAMEEFELLNDDPDTPWPAFAEWFRTYRPNYQETVNGVQGDGGADSAGLVAPAAPAARQWP